MDEKTEEERRNNRKSAESGKAQKIGVRICHGIFLVKRA